MGEIERSGSEATLRVEGDLVASAAERLRPQLRALMAAGIHTVRADLGQAEFVDSMGIGLLIAIHNSLAPRGGSLAVVNVRPAVAHLLKTMRLDRHFRIEPQPAAG